MKKTYTFKMEESLERLLDERAYEQGVSRSHVIREAIAEYLTRDGRVDEGSFLTRAQDLVGVVEADEDLSTDPRHLEGYGGHNS